MKKLRCWRCYFLLMFSTSLIIVVVWFYPQQQQSKLDQSLSIDSRSQENEASMNFLSASDNNDINTLSSSITLAASHDSNHDNRDQLDNSISQNSTVVLVTTLCGHDPKQEELILVMLKSLVLTSGEGQILAIIVADSEDSYLNIAQAVASWPPSTYSILTVSYVPVWYPKGREWMKTFRTLCTTERLYYPFVLRDYDAVIHVDTDTLFLRPVQELWHYFTAFSPKQFLALAPEHEDPENAYYNSYLNKVPYYGKMGLNAGVMLMNLTRMRRNSSSDADWLQTVDKIYQEYKEAPLHFADQDILNVFLHFHPDSVLELPCIWNYRNDFCRFKGNTCSSATKQDGIALLHGNRGVFLSNDEPAFKSIYEAYLNYNWAFDMKRSLLEPLLQSLSSTINTMCGSERDVSHYTKYLRLHYGGE